MVLRLNRRSVCLIIAAGLAALFCLPYFCSDLLALEHDTLFHLSRIEGLSEAIRRGDFLPALYAYKNNGFGYASPLFYCDLFLLPATILYAMHIPIIIVSKIYVFLIAWVGACCALYAMNEYTSSSGLCMIGALLFTFSSYHINDFFIRAALGEALAFSVLPLFMVNTPPALTNTPLPTLYNPILQNVHRNLYLL